MRKKFIKKVILALVISLSVTIAHADRFDDVWGACAGAFETIEQISTCVSNVCTAHGCW